MYAKIGQGQMFGIHTDTGYEFDQKKNMFSKFTVLTYLNDDFEGGSTIFYNDDLKETTRIIPQAGETLVFDIDRFHAGENVTNGIKLWIGTELVCSRLPATLS